MKEYYLKSKKKSHYIREIIELIIIQIIKNSIK